MSIITKPERDTTMVLLGKLKHDTNLKNNASEIKLNTRFIKPRVSMYHDQDLIIEPKINKPISMVRLNAPIKITPMKIPLNETPSPSNWDKAIEALVFVSFNIDTLSPYVITVSANGITCKKNLVAPSDIFSFVTLVQKWRNFMLYLIIKNSIKFNF